MSVKKTNAQRFFQDVVGGDPNQEYFYNLKHVTFCGFHPRDHRYFSFITKVQYTAKSCGVFEQKAYISGMIKNKKDDQAILCCSTYSNSFSLLSCSDSVHSLSLSSLCIDALLISAKKRRFRSGVYGNRVPENADT